MKTLISKTVYESYKKENDKLLEQICQYEDDNDIPTEVVLQYKKISRALIDYERAYHPLPGRVSVGATAGDFFYELDKRIKKEFEGGVIVSDMAHETSLT